MATVRNRYLVRDQREQAIPAPKLQLGPTMLCDGTQGQIVELLNNGTLAIFRASNGPKFTISRRDLAGDRLCQQAGPMALSEALEVLRQLQQLPAPAPSGRV